MHTYMCVLQCCLLKGDLAQFVSKLTLCSIEAGMNDDKEHMLKLVGMAVSVKFLPNRNGVTSAPPPYTAS